mmetsp:Transcript_36291/g.82716  ORF Transcript_36291/g.82716 Transcript_36291/m.82716 type:complete len:274 (+) Transcript_36291:1518-2339(+)
MISHLGTHVAHFDAGQRVVVLIADLEQEDVDSVLLAVEDQLSIHKGMRCSAANVRVPPLHGSERRGVQNELLSLCVVRGLGLKASDVASMAELGLGVTPHHAEAHGTRQPPHLLLLTGLAQQGGQEQPHVGHQRARVDGVLRHPGNLISLRTIAFLRERFVHANEVLEVPLHQLVPVHVIFIIPEPAGNARPGDELAPARRILSAVDERCEFFNTETGLGALSRQKPSRAAAVPRLICRSLEAKRLRGDFGHRGGGNRSGKSGSPGRLFLNCI